MMRVLAAAMLATSAHGQCHEFIGKLQPEGLSSHDFFGWAFGVSGSTVLVGATGAFGGVGAVFAFSLDGHAPTFTQVIAPGTPSSGAYFGRSIDVEGDRAVVGAPRHDGFGQWSGTVYLYRFVDGFWSFDQELLPDDIGSDMRFGRTVAIDGDVVAVGAPHDDVLRQNSGSVYVFRFDGADWIQEQKLLPNDVGHFFGNLIDLSGDVMVIGSPLDNEQGHDSGTAYIFRYVDGAWIQELHVMPEDATFGSRFGQDVAVEGDLVAIGAPGQHIMDIGRSVYLYRHDGEAWQLEDKLHEEDAIRFGWSVDIRDGRVLVGAISDCLDDPFGCGYGAAYVYERIDGTWTLATRLVAPDATYNDEFGDDVALGDDLAFVGAIRDSDFGGYSGGAYAFDLTACAGCAADVNGDGVLNVLDFVAFQLGWQLQEPAADCDSNGEYNVLDFVCFQQRFAEGCE